MTDGNKDIGYEIAAGLGALGWSVAVGARDDERREAAVAKLGAGGADAFGVPLDVTDDASVAAAARPIEERTASTRSSTTRASPGADLRSPRPST